MKNILLFVAFFTFHIYGQAKDLFVFNPNASYIANSRAFYYDNETQHEKSCYSSLSDNIYLTTSYFVFKIEAQRNITENEYENDSLFSKLFIDCINLRNNKSLKYEFINDGIWSRFNYWSFAPYTDNPWNDSGNSICKVVDVGKNCKAIVLRGYRDSIDPESLTIFAVYDNQVKLVFHENMAINKMQTTKDGRTIYELVKVVYPDNTDDILYENYSLCFGDGKITIDRTK
ncbi:MAG: hypothetical protein IKR18_02695 [Bacteroidaceae bacterium]|nr:hypothetical protein [Bacteroidaceae bacterium]